MKQKNEDNRVHATEGIFAPSVANLKIWGTEEEVAAQVVVTESNGRDRGRGGRGGANHQRVSGSESTTFRATMNNPHTTKKDCSEKGIFSMGCARHGVPERLYDIYGGEVAGLAMAAVKHAASSRPESMLVMYDIACQYRQKIESSISGLSVPVDLP